MKTLKILLLLALVASIMLTAVACGVPKNDADASKDDAENNNARDEGVENDDTNDTDNGSTDVDNSGNGEETDDGVNKAKSYVDFIVSVPNDREAVVLQLTDPQIIDPLQDAGLTPAGKEFYLAHDSEELCWRYLREIITNTDPDLILVTGDLVYGLFDHSGERFTEFVEFMEDFDIPWAPVFGNHEAESKKGADWQCAQLEAAENCLFKQRKLTGNGNYTVGIEQSGKLTRVFFMLDSNTTAAASEESLANGHTKTGRGFGDDQIEWYTSIAKKISAASPDTKLSFVFHVQLSVFGDAFSRKYNTTGATSVFIDRSNQKHEGDFGYIGAPMKYPWDTNYLVWNGLKRLGVDSIFVGHEHANSASIVYEGVRLQYGMKSSAYERLNFIDKYGNITSTSCSSDTPWVGGSYFSLAKDGSIVDPGIYYCENAGGNIDWDGFETEVVVNGLQKDTDLTVEGNLSIEALMFNDDIGAYKVRASDMGKVHVNVSLLKNKTSFTFSVFVPTSSANKLSDIRGEFSIRTKPNDIEPERDGTGDGYIDFHSETSNEDCRLIFEQWQTFTVDISDFGDTCTEFAFVIARGNTIYLRDITIT